MNIELIKTETEKHFKSEGKEEIFNEKLQKAKSDIDLQVGKWNAENPGKDFSEFREQLVKELRTGMQFLEEILTIGIILIALEQVAPEQKQK